MEARYCPLCPRVYIKFIYFFFLPDRKREKQKTFKTILFIFPNIEANTSIAGNWHLLFGMCIYTLYRLAQTEIYTLSLLIELLIATDLINRVRITRPLYYFYYVFVTFILAQFLL